MRDAQQLHLNLFIHGRGHHEAAWRHPKSSGLSLKRRAASAGRAPDQILILPGLSPVIGATEAGGPAHRPRG